MNNVFLQEIADYMLGKNNLMAKKTLDYIDIAFPFKGSVMYGKDIVINKDIVVGPAASSYFINADILTFDGGSITSITTALTITANNRSSKYRYFGVQR
ncbi:hypothetical protein [Isorropodon fossajaponicum symbiont]|uniref:hypothetical protein n=1 Tax=Isorropodon fossajaponicum symbiont TaxID=883811 RepID=UPI00191662D4|nr:hypothetical protein [Isorropodon fossajaponicum symbiont]